MRFEKQLRKDFIYVNNNTKLLRYFQRLDSRFEFIQPAHKKEYVRGPNYIQPTFSSCCQAIWQTPSANLSALDIFYKHQNIRVLGTPGSGKSTFLHKIILTLTHSENNLAKIALGDLVPFLIDLSKVSTEPNTWDDLWESFLASQTETEGLDSDLLLQLFSKGQAMVLLDNLDAVAASQLSKIGACIHQGIESYPNCRFILVSRTFGFSQIDLFGKSLMLDLYIQPNFFNFANKKIKL